ncbi:MAG TPA: hypothetical protein VNK04_17005 [Gemmataceae bacterium]|jgi:hypothetical protein|nr:hypothetical protein [Gemmataceae bacterium]
MVNRAWRVLTGFALLGALTAAGCARGPEFAEVEGTARLNGKPLANVRVEFMPDPEQGTEGPTSSGITDKDGRYRLFYADQRPGVVVGKHRVLIHDLAPYENLPPGRLPDSYKLKPPRVPARYYDSSSTPLRKEVKAGGPQTIDLEVTTP